MIGKIWSTIRAILIILYVLSLPLTFMYLGAHFFGYMPMEDSYSYEVKAQQVMDTDRVEGGDVTEFDNLSADEQELLHDAFKKTDHFMGTSEVTLDYQEERLDTFNDWRTVESNGVLLLVTVNERVEQSPDHDAYKPWHWILVLAPVYLLAGFVIVIFST